MTTTETRPARLATDRESAPMPLLRQTSTVGMPDGEGSATIEIIALSDAGGPSWHELPEAKLAGWMVLGCGPLEVRVRVTW